MTASRLDRARAAARAALQWASVHPLSIFTWLVMAAATLNTPMVWQVLSEKFPEGALGVPRHALGCADPADATASWLDRLSLSVALTSDGLLALDLGAVTAGLSVLTADLAPGSGELARMVLATRAFSLLSFLCVQLALIGLGAWLQASRPDPRPPRWERLSRAVWATAVVLCLVMVGSTGVAPSGEQVMSQPVPMMSNALVVALLLRYRPSRDAHPLFQFFADLGRVAVVMLVLETLGELVWFSAMRNDASATGGLLTFRTYAIFTWLMTCGFFVSLAMLADRQVRIARRQDRSAMWGVMPIALMLLSASVEQLLHPEQVHLATRHDSDGEPARNTLATARSDTAAWLDGVTARLDRMDPASPVVLVAASGGGTRAAIWTHMALKALEQRPLPACAPIAGVTCLWSDQILAVSSVSGGSLGAAAWMYPRPEAHTATKQAGAQPCSTSWHNAWYELVLASAYVSDGHTDDPEVHSKAVQDVLDGLRFDHDFDGILTQHTAVLLRGARQPALTRGAALAAFWRARRLQDLDDAQHTWSPDRPMLLTNMTDVEMGHRVIAAYPRLPTGLIGGVGHAVSVSDLDPGGTLRLPEAVRGSSAFPFGLDVMRVLATDGTAWRWNDGGVLDNTGLDTVALLLQQLNRLSSAWYDEPACGEPDAPYVVGATPMGCLATEDNVAKARAIMTTLRDRSLIVLELDAGAKGVVTRSSFQNTVVGEFGLSLDSLFAAMETDDERTRKAFLFASTETMTAGPAPAPRTPGEPVSPPEVLVRHVDLSYRPHPDDAIMTAWGLGADDIGRLLATVADITDRKLSWLDAHALELVRRETLGQGRIGGEPTDCNLRAALDGIRLARAHAPLTTFDMVRVAGRSYPLTKQPAKPAWRDMWVPALIDRADAPDAFSVLAAPWGATADRRQEAYRFRKEGVDAAMRDGTPLCADLREALPGWRAMPRGAFLKPDALVQPPAGRAEPPMRVIGAEESFCANGTVVTWIQLRRGSVMTSGIERMSNEEICAMVPIVDASAP